MKTAALLAAAVLAVASVEAMTPIPKEHHARFLEERAALEDELEAWKSSAAGRAAKKNNYYHEDPHESEAALKDQLSRFFLTKLSIEKAQKANPQATFSVNSPFTLMTDEEFAHFVARSAPSHTPTHADNERHNVTTAKSLGALPSLPRSVDWSATKCMTPVKDQGYCGGCWAFAAIGCLENALCIATGNLTALSEEDLLSCDDIDQGCGGGLTEFAFDFLQYRGYAVTEASLPFTSYEGTEGNCTDTVEKVPVSFWGILPPQVTNNYPTSVDFMRVLQEQTTTASMAAGEMMKQYSGGIITQCQPGTDMDLNHAVVVVGYDDESFKIRNSWGADWGDHGYFRLARTAQDAACGLINSYAKYPLVA